MCSPTLLKWRQEMTSGSRGIDFRLFKSGPVQGGRNLLRNFHWICHGLSKNILISKKLKTKKKKNLSANSSLQYAEAVYNNRENKTILGAGVMVLDNWKASVHKDRWAYWARKSLILVWSRSRSDYQLCVKSLLLTLLPESEKIKWDLDWAE